MARPITKVLYEAIIVGIVTLIVGTLVSYVLKFSPFSVDLLSVCQNWNQYMIMEVSLFLTGFLVHLAFEYSPFGNLNQIYCERTQF